MNFIDFLAFVAAMIFLIVSSRKTAKQRQETSLETEPADAFEKHEAERIKDLQDVMAGKRQVRHASRLPSETSHKERHDKPWLARESKTEKKAAKIKTVPLSHVAKGEAYQKPEDAIFSSIQMPATNAYAITARRQASKARLLMQQLQSNKQMVVLHEIFGPPKGL